MEELIAFLPPEALVAEFIISALSEVHDWGQTFMNVDIAQKHSKGEDVIVAVLDTGVPNHSDINDNLVQGYSTLADKSDIYDRQGHGCISPQDKVWTSEYGVSSIESLWETVASDNILIGESDNSKIKMIDSLNIKTLARMKDSTMGLSLVKAVHKLEYEGEIFTIKTENTELSLTPWHPVYVVSSRRGEELTVVQKRADELEINDSIFCSRYFEDSLPYLTIPFDVQFNCKYCGYKPNRGLGKRNVCRNCNRSKWYNELSNLIQLDESLAKWLGLLISDGHIMASSTSVEFCGNDLNLIEEFEYLTDKVFQLKCHRYSAKNEKLYRTRVHSSQLIKFLLDYFGLNRGNKSLTVELPKLIEKSNSSVIGAFVAGIIEGDGHVDSSWKIRISCGSKKFSYALKDLLRMRGIRTSVLILKNPSGFNGKTNESNEHYNIRVSPHECITKHLKIKGFENNLANPQPLISESILNIERSLYTGLMYDLTVDNTKNYVSNSLVVSNTHVAGTIAALENGVGVIGVAPKCKIMSIKVLDNSGCGSYQSIVDGINLAVEKKADIISMSLGCPSPTPQLQEAVQNAFKAGVIMVAAAGNSHGAVDYPAAYPEVIAVSAVDKHGNIADFSCRGDSIKAAAPGVDCYSTYLNNQYALLSGTSQATPYISGVCAILLAWSRANPSAEQIHNGQDMLKVLSELCDANNVLAKQEYGFGIPNFANYMPWKDQ
jgi:intein/homing endonuclease